MLCCNMREQTMRSSCIRGAMMLCLCAALVSMSLTQDGQVHVGRCRLPGQLHRSKATPPRRQRSPPPSTAPARHLSYVRGRCACRCSATAYRKPCVFFCQKCSAAWLCVPSGTYGNKQPCPCYNDWRTKRGEPKWP